jgi:protein-L-isoaspartate(D-aspartate) O-methyltransferase
VAFNRVSMVEEQIAARGVRDVRVLAAMRDVPRENFVAEGFEGEAFRDAPLPIAEGQTISQPFIVALMAEAALIEPGDRVLEVGAGSGYAAAVLGRLAARVTAVERRASLARLARERLGRLGYDNVEVVEGDGTLGWPEAAPFDAIVVSAGGPRVPEALMEQLALGGRLVIPVEARWGTQDLRRLIRRSDGFEEESLGPVRFVPLIGAQGWKETTS